MKTLFRANKLTAIAIAFLFLAVTWTQFNMARWDKRNIIIWDVVGYYSYLPALVYGDFTLEDEELRKDFDYFSWGRDLPGGKKIIQMSSGTSFLYAPFFFTAYFIDSSDGLVDIDGPIYHKAISLAAIFWLMIGLVFLGMALRKHFPDRVVAIVLLLLVLATNLFHYSTAEPGMSHVYSFALFALFLWQIQKWWEKQTIIRAIFIGFVFGLIVLVRPTNIVVGIIFLFSAFPNGLNSLVRRWYYLPLMGLFALAIWLPQLFYWKWMTGSWLYFSYNDQSFFFDNPHIIKGLFSWRKGWFIYTPVMLFAVAGLFSRSMPGTYRYSIPVYLAINIYIVLSWWCWWYGGAFGLRAFIESYVIMAIPLAAIVKQIIDSRRAARLILLAVLALLLGLNLFQSYQYKKTLIHWDSMTWRAYKAVFLKLKFPSDYAELIEEPDYENARKGLPERTLNERFPANGDQ